MGYPHPDFEWLSRLDRLAREISRGGGGKRFPGGQSTSQTPPPPHSNCSLLASTSIIRDTPSRLRMNYQILLDLVTHRLHPSRRAFRRPLPGPKREKATFLRRTNRDIVTFLSYIAACPPFLQVACKVYYLRKSCA